RCLRKIALPRSGGVWDRQFTYTHAGDLRAIEDTLHGTRAFEYDAAHRLVAEIDAAGGRERYEHDTAGKLRIQPGLDGVRIGQANQLVEAAGWTFSYDHRDHVAARVAADGREYRYEYDSLDRLVGCRGPGLDWTAEYDALCRRVRKRWNGR